MTPDIITAAPTVVNAFGQTGGILGLIILALLAIVGLVAYMAWKFMSGLMDNHEKRMDAQEARHQRDRDTANQQWQEVIREITADNKTVLDSVVTNQKSTLASLDVVSRNIEVLRRRRA